jgi:hypothetical protein
MLTRFYSKIVEGFTKGFAEACQREIRDHELIGKIRQVTFSHGRAISSTDVGGLTWPSEMKPQSTRFQLSRTALESGDRNAFRQSIHTGIEKMQADMVRLMFSSLSEICDKTGNSVDCGGQPLNADTICQLLEKIEIPFDKNGQPMLPTICVSPEMETQTRELLDDPIVHSRIARILRQKWMDRYTLWHLMPDTH